MRSSHASYKHVQTHFEAKKKERWELGFGVKSRNEPRNILYVVVLHDTLHVNLVEAHT